MSTNDYYVVPPDNRTRIVLSVTAFNIYVSVESLDNERRWKHREDCAARGFGSDRERAKKWAEEQWKALQRNTAAVSEP